MRSCLRKSEAWVTRKYIGINTIMHLWTLKQYVIWICFKHISWSTKIMSRYKCFHSGTTKWLCVSFAFINIMSLNLAIKTNKIFNLAPYTSSRNRVVRYHMLSFHYSPPLRNKNEMFNRYPASLCSIFEINFGVWKEKCKILSYFLR